MDESKYMPYPWIDMGYKITIKKGKIVKIKPYTKVIKMKRPKPKPC